MDTPPSAVTPPSDKIIGEFLDQAIRIAVRNVSDGGGPFGALVVTADGRTHDGVNRVALDNDPTAHAEVVAIRKAAAASGNFNLSGAVLYASCEPCPLCLAAALWARVDRVYFAADRNGAAAAGFDDALFYEYFDGARPELMPVRQTDLPASDLPFQAWRDNPDRTEY
jgi:guanine deaminase